MADGMPAVSAAPEQAPAYDESATPLETLITWFEDALEVTETARKLSERDRDYYDHKQLTAEEIATLKKRGQPDVVINRIQPKINYLIGYEATNRTDPKAFPRTPMDEAASEAATDALRYTEDASELKQHFSSTWEHMLIEGYGGLELVIEPGANDQNEIRAVGWDWDRLFYDPHSRKPDFSDARYLGGVIWLDVEDATARWPDHADEIERAMTERTASETHDDRPTHKAWYTSGKRKRVRVVQMYHRNERGEWLHCTFTKGAKLESMVVPFRDQDGKSWCPMILQSAFVNRSNERYGLVRQMISVQDEVNKRRSKALHRLSMRQVRAEAGAVADIDLAKQELAKPNGWIETNPGFDFEILPAGDLLAAELQMLQEAKNEIELMGPNAAMQGKDGDAPSGRAILANQQGGQTEISFLVDRHRHFKRRVYQGAWNLIRQYKDQEWWVRVTDSEKNVKFVGFNRRVTKRDEMAQTWEKQGMPPQEIEARLKELANSPAAPQLEQVVRIDNQPTQMNMDITIEDVPDVANIAEEQFQSLVKLAPAVTFPPTVYLKASSLRNKDALLDELNGPQDSPEQQAMKQRIDALQVAELESKVQLLQAQIAKYEAEANKVSVEADMAQMPLGVINQPAVVPAPQAAPQLSEASLPPNASGDPEMPMQPPPGQSGAEMMG